MTAQMPSAVPAETVLKDETARDVRMTAQRPARGAGVDEGLPASASGDPALIAVASAARLATRSC